MTIPEAINIMAKSGVDKGIHPCKVGDETDTLPTLYFYVEETGRSVEDVEQEIRAMKIQLWTLANQCGMKIPFDKIVFKYSIRPQQWVKDWLEKKSREVAEIMLSHLKPTPQS